MCMRELVQQLIVDPGWWEGFKVKETICQTSLLSAFVT